MTDSEEPKSLAEILVDKNLLSVAQIELAIADQEINDIPLEEILMVRGWITQEKLYEVAPWLKPGSGVKAPASTSKGASFSKPMSRTGAFSKPSLTPPAGVAGQASPEEITGAKTSSGGEQATKASVPEAAKAASFSSNEAASSTGADNSAVRRAMDKASQMYQKPALTKPKDDGAAGGSADSKPAAKPSDIPKEPPQRPAGEPVVIVSPVQTDTEQNMKSYKEVLKKILALE